MLVFWKNHRLGADVIGDSLGLLTYFRHTQPAQMATYNHHTYLLLLVQWLEDCSSHRYVCVGVQGVCFCFQWSACMCQLVEHRRAPSCPCLLLSSAGVILDLGSEEEAAGDSGEGVGSEDFTAS